MPFGILEIILGKALLQIEIDILMFISYGEIEEKK